MSISQEPKLSCIVVDDEPMALNLIESYVQKTPFLDLKGKCSSAIQALKILNTEQIDLIFLDIQMPDLTGIELSKTLSKTTRVIFTTAFDSYALQGYKVDALDYLLKPFNYTEFLLAANKALSWFKLVSTATDTTTTPPKKYLFVKSEYKQVKLELDDILYFEGLKDYIKIYLASQSKPVLTLKSLKALEQELPSNFMRIHRSFIISLDKIDEIERSQVIISGKRITVSEGYKEAFQNYISDNSIQS
ncbi:MAG: LytTR family DNA-binding domain-containing protein [Bacteroidota bacterium]|uniref:LytR/AlgR family response regulator transcription factor n=1 Tax=Leeuwenhoekiella TaxID=283735 RepID=UPI000C434CCD|nr:MULTISPECIES: LytTR family DNA-binding domain-containing protein [Leeuwenhoekiella]MAS20505.1 DNA-binding response regulator [Leeuwenhoekiella sp.]MEC7782735.1 LytTR family DNA-binding domain-containing protein [Bacteroidota bacterium]MEE3148165.1 LytTR family DNA-binding domain-containing protein [Bacteroidota bacterium]MEE3224950.1 LytTR family DNA-binding domain-containing protein [Bacteroidota bacterium]MEE3245302.1 LytTR family DNA-binding domain-containing protein [Bacteroidota bacter|tara:strand:+ start:201 stop:941 length:741 start_codon:yes stop_codon:yes gene_type:complete